MGYELHITRAADWTESESAPISLDEWKAYVASDPEMRMDNYAEATTTSGETVRYESEGLAVWTAHPALESQGGWLDYRSGHIVVKYPDSAFITKIKSIAEALGARVKRLKVFFQRTICTMERVLSTDVSMCSRQPNRERNGFPARYH